MTTVVDERSARKKSTPVIDERKNGEMNVFQFFISNWLLLTCSSVKIYARKKSVLKRTSAI
jgi:hypothetical protein